MTRMKHVKSSKRHHYFFLHSKSLFFMRDIHDCMRFLSFLLIFSIESEKLSFKYLFKKGFLRSQEEIYKYTKWRQKKHEKNTKDLKNYWMCPIGNISNNPDHQTKPYYKEIDNNATKNQIRIYPRKNCWDIHIDSIIDKSKRRQLDTLFTVSFFYYNEISMKWPHHNIAEKWHNISFSVSPVSPIPCSGDFF